MMQSSKTNRWNGKAIAAMSVGLALLGMTLGGCNNKLKAENEELRAQQTLLTERAAAAETAAMQNKAAAEAASAERARIQNELMALRSAPAPQPAAIVAQPMQDFGGPIGSGGGGGGKRGGGGGGGGEIYRVSGDVLFAPGQATIKPEARKELDKIAASISREHSGRNIRIEGHTDSDPIKKAKFSSNQALSKARADAVRDYLSRKGISRSLIETVGMGSSKPAGSKAASRRVEIAIVN